MARYTIDSHFWDDDKVTLLTDEDGWSNLLQYAILQSLLTGPQRGSVPGLQRATAQTIADVIRQPPDRVAAALDDICERFPSMVQLDKRWRVLRLPNGPRHNPHRGPRNIVAWFQGWKHLPDSPLKYAHIESLVWCIDPKLAPSVETWNQTFGPLEQGRYVIELGVGPVALLPRSEPPALGVSDTPRHTPTVGVSDTPRHTPTVGVSDTPRHTANPVSAAPVGSSGGVTELDLQGAGAPKINSNVVPLHERPRDSAHLQHTVSHTPRHTPALSEIRDQRSEIRDQRSEIRDQGALARVPARESAAAADLVEQATSALPRRSANPTVSLDDYLAGYAPDLRTAELSARLAIDLSQIDVALDAMSRKCMARTDRVASWDRTAARFLASQAVMDRKKHETNRNTRGAPTRSSQARARSAAESDRRSRLGDKLRAKRPPGT